MEQIAYASQGLAIRAFLCRPDDSLAHATLLFNHGGFGGIGSPTWQEPPGSCFICDLCRGYAKSGYLFAASSYRGEDGSEGKVEVCQGEVDDVASLKCALAADPASDGRFGTMGVSHGGCITLRLAESDPTLHVAVDLVGPADWALVYDFWQEQLASGTPVCVADQARGLTGAICSADYTRLSGQVSSAIGGPPSEAPAAYAARSPVNELPLRAPTLVVHGTLDYLVDEAQACLMRQALAGQTGPLRAWYIDRSGNPVSNPGAPACGGGFDSQPPPASADPKDWPEGTVFFLLEGEDHNLFDSPLGKAGRYAGTAAQNFVLAHMPP